MITRSRSSCQIPTWQNELAKAFTDPADLLAYLQLDHRLLPAAMRAARDFGLRVPRGYARLMQKSRIDDPLPPQAEQDSKRRLSDTIKCLNNKQINELIRFHGDGTGEGITWEQVEPIGVSLARD